MSDRFSAKTGTRVQRFISLASAVCAGHCCFTSWLYSGQHVAPAWRGCRASRLRRHIFSADGSGDSGFDVRPWTAADVGTVQGLAKRVQRARDASFNVEGPENEFASADGLGPYDGDEGSLFVATEKSSGLILGCAAMVVGDEVVTFESGRSLSQPMVAALRRVCIDDANVDINSRGTLMYSLVEASESAALAKGANSIIAVGYETSTQSQPTVAFLQGLGYEVLGEIKGVPGVTQMSKNLRPGLGDVNRPSFEGKWRMDLKASDSLREVLSALGVNFIIARLIDNLGVTQIIKQTQGGLDITVQTMMGSDTCILPFDGTITEVPSPTGGTNKQTSGWTTVVVDGATLPALETRQFVRTSDDASVIFQTLRYTTKPGEELVEHVNVLRDDVVVARARRILTGVEE
eukprot:TRINITY_DN8699_c0_g1_i2.p1 TRINITY_DN8699_c0_g1~~TRINITY_DN8699_c0_g1_i2.p1  ORF type:complete len:405 (-),score=54.62 TRINITY_DN8699_c0_g1_i2:631-1845(-)